MTAGAPGRGISGIYMTVGAPGEGRQRYIYDCWCAHYIRYTVIKIYSITRKTDNAPKRGRYNFENCEEEFK